MPCTHITVGNTHAIVCSRGRRATVKCHACIKTAPYLCDHDTGNGKTCDRPMCADHAQQIGSDRHYCFAHRVRPGQTAELFAEQPERF